MRKTDYASLARLVRDHRATAEALKKTAARPSEMQARMDALEALAIEFARVASVDREAFLKACGVQT